MARSLGKDPAGAHSGARTYQRANRLGTNKQFMESSPAKPVLLHGVTGSGKTEIYMRAVTEALKEGQQVLVLVPEIAMTPQTVRYMARYPNQVGLYHSQLSEGERYDTRHGYTARTCSSSLGPRSALFLPYQSLKLIVIDECDHDPLTNRSANLFTILSKRQ